MTSMLSLITLVALDELFRHKVTDRPMQSITFLIVTQLSQQFLASLDLSLERANLGFKGSDVGDCAINLGTLLATFRRV